MPELPDITVYLDAIERRVVGHAMWRVQLVSPFVLRSVDPPISEVGGKTVRELRRIGKRIVFGLDDELFLVIHLMVAGRFKWHDKTPKLSRRLALAAIEFRYGKPSCCSQNTIPVSPRNFPSNMLWRNIAAFGPAKAVASQIVQGMRPKGGWGTWIRTKTNRVRADCSTVKLSPKHTPRPARAI